MARHLDKEHINHQRAALNFTNSYTQPHQKFLSGLHPASRFAL
jgi:hypothetical protein